MAKSTIKPPNKVILTLLGIELPQAYQDYFDGLDESGGNMPYDLIYHWEPRKSYDEPNPAIHCILQRGDIQQRSMKNQTTLENIFIEIHYYTENYDEIWSMYQSIMQIIIENHKVQDVDDGTNVFENSGIESLRATEVEWDTIYSDREEHSIHVMILTVDVQVQNSYIT
ncbi:hypothetical protein LCGC14_2082230 [marine sediment metagenome]|uniref:Uncharacterized protein n=1 Tax=marine sediment metagenome TaxID=412755 RepID=A0A0F9EFG3_9ZZZZ